MRRKLTDDAIAEIRRLEEITLTNPGLYISHKAVANRFGVSARAISRFISGYTYVGEFGTPAELRNLSDEEEA